MTIAIFDLDNTLISGDSDFAWGEFIVERKIVNHIDYQHANEQFYQDYKKGTLNLQAYLEFALQPLSQYPIEQLYQWREEFIECKIKPLLLNKAFDLIESHRSAGDYLLIITATNRFITEPIATLFNVDELIATEPEIKNGCYTGKFTGTPSFQQGKVVCLNHWIKNTSLSLSGSYGYSDSHNDISLLNQVDYPHAVDPDDKLKTHAQQHNWKIITLRD